MKKIMEHCCKKLSILLNSNVDNECIICKELNKDGILLLPCSHYQLCTDCFSNMNEKKCPICREKIEYYIEYNRNTNIKKIKSNEINSKIVSTYPDNSSDEEYEEEYLLYNYNNRMVPYQERVILRRMGISPLVRNNSRSRFSTWWPE